jgi:hypothetical protein
MMWSKARFELKPYPSMFHKILESRLTRLNQSWLW